MSAAAPLCSPTTALLPGCCPTQVGAMGLLFYVFTFVYHAVEGFGSAASTRVSNELGAGHPHAARVASSVCLVLGVLACLSWWVTGAKQGWLVAVALPWSIIVILVWCAELSLGALSGLSSNTIALSLCYYHCICCYNCKELIQCLPCNGRSLALWNVTHFVKKSVHTWN